MCSDQVKYKCPECGWIGTENEMDADFIVYADEHGEWDGEMWSNWICPSCYMWQELSDYEVIK